MPNSKHLTHGISNLVSLITKTKLGLSPVIITMEKIDRRRRGTEGKQFAFEASWLEEAQCREVVKGVWEFGGMEGEMLMSEAVQGLAIGLQDWSTNVLGDLEKRLKKAKWELEGCRRMIISQEIVTKEAVLRFKVDRIEEQIDIFWRQRDHVNWLSKGDRNTAFFHQCCKERRGGDIIE
jgi:hypothetical protein